MTKCKECLTTSQVREVNDVRFALREKNQFNQTTKQSDDESKSAQHLSSYNRADSWHVIEPWLRLNHCMLEEEALEACVSICKREEREGTDGHNSV